VEAVLRTLARFDEAGDVGLDALKTLAAVAASSPSDVRDITRVMAALSRCPARVIDPVSGVLTRSDPDGIISYPDDSAAHPGWISGCVLAGEGPAFWFERTGTPSVVEAVVLDSVATILSSMRFADSKSASIPRDDLSLLLTIEDPVSLEGVLKRLKLKPETLCRAIARPGSIAQVEVIAPRGMTRGGFTAVTNEADRVLGGRVGIGSVQRADHLSRSWETAQVALAFAAEGTDDDPGPMVIDYAELGIWAQFHSDLLRRGSEFEDVQLLTKVIGSSPWAGPTLVAIVTHSSLRLAAAALFTHHSTVQSRTAVLEQKLAGWKLNSAQGRNRLAMALMARRYLLHPPTAGRPRSMTPPLIFGDH